MATTTAIGNDSAIPTSSSSNEIVTYEEIYQRYQNAGQEHVLEYYDTIPSLHEKQSFLQQLHTINVEQLPSLLSMASSSSAATVADNENENDNNDHIIQPFTGTIGRSTTTAATTNSSSSSSSSSSSTTGSNTNTTMTETDIWCKTGMTSISSGHVATLVLAGGQGTRLGYTGPKGMYQLMDVPSQKSLFQFICERIFKLNQLASSSSSSTTTTTGSIDPAVSQIKNTLPFYIMTSPLNHTETVSYFERHHYFNLGKENVFFFQQGMLPCLTVDGKIILESKDRVAMAPDGNGGIYPSLQSSGAIRHMQDRNVQYLHVFSIDNALVKPADPIFIGYCITHHADCGNKVVWKSHPHEAVGVMATRNKKPCIVEYSEITKEMAELTMLVTNDDDQNNNSNATTTTTATSTEQLVYGAGNICNHFYTLSFIIDTILPNMGNLYHIAHKKIPYYDPTTQTTMVPTTGNNGIKLETFIFDVFPLSTNMCIYDVNRADEFAPVKNAPGAVSDTPASAGRMISSLAQCWVKAAGGILIGADNTSDNNNDTTELCEISPLTSYAGEGLVELVKGKEIQRPFHL